MFVNGFREDWFWECVTWLAATGESSSRVTCTVGRDRRSLTEDPQRGLLSCRAVSAARLRVSSGDGANEQPGRAPYYLSIREEKRNAEQIDSEELSDEGLTTGRELRDTDIGQRDKVSALFVEVVEQSLPIVECMIEPFNPVRRRVDYDWNWLFGDLRRRFHAFHLRLEVRRSPKTLNSLRQPCYLLCPGLGIRRPVWLTAGRRRSRWTPLRMLRRSRRKSSAGVLAKAVAYAGSHTTVSHDRFLGGRSSIGTLGTVVRVPRDGIRTPRPRWYR
jgi:hypothetical protein